MTRRTSETWNLPTAYELTRPQSATKLGVDSVFSTEADPDERLTVVSLELSPNQRYLHIRTKELGYVVIISKVARVRIYSSQE